MVSGVRSAAIVGLCAFLLAAPVLAWAWTPECCLTPGDAAASSPCLGIGPDGRMHAAYVADFGSPLMYYRVWQGTAWSSAQLLPSPGYKTAGTQMAFDTNGHIHVVAIYRVDGTIDTPYTVYYWEYDGIVWSGPTMLSDGQGGDSDNCASPRIGVDRLGNIHVLWSEGNRVGGKADLIYRRRVGGVWQNRVNLTNNGASGGYGSCAPDMCIEPGGDGIHIVWHDGFSGKDLLYYTKSPDLGNTWPASPWTRISNADYGKGASMVLDRNNLPNIWWTDMDGGGTKFSAYRRWNGSTWTPIENWNARPFMAAAFDSSNVMHYAYHSGSEMSYCTYSYSSGFSGGELVSTGANTYKTDAASIVVNSSGSPSILWLERKGEWPGTSYIFFSTAMPLPAPDSVTGFASESSDQVVRLRWRTPGSINFTGTLIRCKSTGYPTGPTDGTLVCDRPAVQNYNDTFTHSGLTNDVTYYYAAWSYDGSGNCSAPTYQAGRPTLATVGKLKAMPDGTAVDFYGKVVTAVLPGDGCIYVEELDRVGGMRVLTSQTGLVVGDRVNVAGSMGTRVVSGYPAERQIAATGVTKASSGAPLEPLAMGCGALGGAAIPPLVPGVRDGSGANNMGSLVKIAGRVTKILSTYIFVDDGSKVENVSGVGPEVGVMVRLPAAPSFPVGSVVSVVGIVEGSIPTGWTTNRRYLRARDANDVVVLLNPSNGAISGVVTDSGGAGLAGATVSTSTGGYSAVTGTGGHYTMSNVAPGTYSVTGSKPGYQPQTLPGVVVSSGETAHADFALTLIPVEVLTNGDFEAGFTDFWGGRVGDGWSPVYRNQASADNTEWVDFDWGVPQGHSQQVYVSLQGTGESGITQRVTGLAPGSSFRFSAQAYQSSTTSTCWISADPNGGTTMPTRTASFPSIAGQWSYQEVTGTVGASGAVSVFLWAWHQSNPPGMCWFDDASLSVW